MATKNIIDCPSGKELRATSEELSRQTMLLCLAKDYGYDKGLQKTEFSVKKSPSDIRHFLPVDIAVFDNPGDARSGKAKIFVETKKPTSKDGLGQLKDYMNFDQNVKYGIWYNGDKSIARRHLIERDLVEAETDELLNERLRDTQK